MNFALLEPSSSSSFYLLLRRRFMNTMNVMYNVATIKMRLCCGTCFNSKWCQNHIFRINYCNFMNAISSFFKWSWHRIKMSNLLHFPHNFLSHFFPTSAAIFPTTFINGLLLLFAITVSLHFFIRIRKYEIELVNQ